MTSNGSDGGAMRIDAGFILREIAGEYVIVPTGKTALIFNGMLTANAMGIFLWEHLKEDVTEEELVASVVSEYDIDEKTARNDIQEFLEVLRQSKILIE